MEARKQQEREFHDFLRSDDLKKDKTFHQHYTSNCKYYAVDRANRSFCEEWLRERCSNKRVLDYCCGEGDYSVIAAKYGGYTVGIDISEVSIRKCVERAKREGYDAKTSFMIMDAEELKFDDDSFDIIICAGVLHHLDLARAFSELARVVKPAGEIICMEALRHNPLIQLYRRLTPHLRTPYEINHILGMKDVHLSRSFFRKIEVRFFHLATLLAIPFRKLPIFSSLLSLLEKIDGLLLKNSWFQKQAWMVTFILSEPIKGHLRKL